MQWHINLTSKNDIEKDTKLYKQNYIIINTIE